MMSNEKNEGIHARTAVEDRFCGLGVDACRLVHEKVSLFLKELLLKMVSECVKSYTRRAQTHMNTDKLVLEVSRYGTRVIWSLVAWDESHHPFSLIKCTCKQIPFIEQEYEGSVPQQAIPAYICPQANGVFQAVGRGVFLEELVERKRGKEHDGTGVIEVLHPSWSCVSRPVDVVDVPVL